MTRLSRRLLTAVIFTAATLFVSQVAFADATLTSDHPDYAPGTTAVLTGTGFNALETVTLHVVHADGSPNSGADHDPWTVTADENGGFTTTWHVCIDDCVGKMLLATADGGSGAHGEVNFSDSQPIGTGIVSSVTPIGTTCVGFTAAVGSGPDNWEISQGGTYSVKLTNVTECSEGTITVFVQFSGGTNFCFNAALSGANEYTGTVTIPNPACNTMPISYKCGADQPCNNANTYAAQGPSTTGSVHFRASTFDASCNKTGNDTNCAGCVCTAPPLIAGCTAGTEDLLCNPASIPGASTSVTASDNCGPVSVTPSVVDELVGTCGHKRTITYTATNTCGTSTCEKIYTWTEDTTAPEITATGTTLALGCNPTAAQIEAALGSASATDNCGGTVTPTATDGALNGVGEGCGRSQSRTWSASDGCGNAATSVFRTVTWTVDTEKPVITATGTTLTLGCNPLAADIEAALGSATATDNCGDVAPTPSTGSVSSDGCNRSQTRTWNVSDGCLNAATPAVRNVTWKVDTENPVITATGTTLTLGCNPSAVDIEAALGSATATDNCGDVTPTPTDGSVLSNGCGRSQSRTWNVSDGCSNAATPAVRNVTWKVDTEPPVITPTGTKLALGCNPSAADIEAALGSATATDNCGPVTPTPSTGSVSSTGCDRSQTRTWNVSDACGNAADAQSRTVTWRVDTTPPVISCPGDVTSLLCQGPVNFTVTATDGCDGPVGVTLSYSPPLSGTSFPVGVTTVTATAKDGCGNPATCSFKVTVYFCNCPRTVGFWGQQCPGTTAGATKFNTTQMNTITACVDAHADIFTWGTSSYSKFCQTVNTSKTDQRSQAKRQFAGLLANLCATGQTADNGDVVSLDPNTMVSFPGFPSMTIGQLINDVDDRLVMLEPMSLKTPSVKDAYDQIINALDKINNNQIPFSKCPSGAPAMAAAAERPRAQDIRAHGEEDAADTQAARETGIQLYRAVPNPFNATTRIAYAVGGAGEHVSITIYDVAGRQVRKLVDAFQAAGRHEEMWDGRGEHGEPAELGVYFIRAIVGNEHKMMTVVRTR